MATRLTEGREYVEFEGKTKDGKRVPGQAIDVETAKAHAKAAGLKNFRVTRGGEK